MMYNFYPRPPRGGRPKTQTLQNSVKHFYPRPPRGGRPEQLRQLLDVHNFYPRPPRGGRPFRFAFDERTLRFLSTPSARRATLARAVRAVIVDISIHALREEGDSTASSLAP